MGLEIERKFTVDQNTFLELNSFLGVLDCDEQYITQGYILAKNATVRIRYVSYNDRRKPTSFITIKSKSKNISRLEFEYEIPSDEALEIMSKICSVFIKKIRYIYKDDETGLIWEIDFFKDKNEGLVIAEVELNSELQEIKKPSGDFILKDVSDDKRLSNISLAMNPYCNWENQEI